MAKASDFSLETAEERFLRSKAVGLGLDVASDERYAGISLGTDDPADDAQYEISEGVWRPDGRGANQTIYSPFMWKGKKVRALRPAPKFKKGEQWSRPQAENNDEFIGIMTGDARLTGTSLLSSKFSGYGPGELPGRKVPLGYNVMSNLQLHAKNRDTGGKMGERLYGVDEDSMEAEARRDHVLSMLAQEDTNPAIGKPDMFRRMAVHQQTAAELEGWVNEDRVKEFLLDPEANEDYNELAMGALPQTLGVNVTGDFNTDGAENMVADQGSVRYAQEKGVLLGDVSRLGVRRAGAAAYGSDDSPPLASTTLNAVKVSESQMQGVNKYGQSDSIGVSAFEFSDPIAAKSRIESKDPRRRAAVLFNRNERAPDLGLNDGQLDPARAILTSARRTRRKEQDQGSNHAATTSADQDVRDTGPLSMSRRYRRKEQDQGSNHVSHTSADQDVRDAGPLSMSRRYRRKEQDQGSNHISQTSADQDGRDAGPLTMSRRYRRKEQASGAVSASQASADQDLRDAAPLSMARRYRIKEQHRPDPTSATGNLDEMQPHDFHQRLAAPKRRTNTTRLLPNSHALLPYGTPNDAGEIAGKERSIMGQVPSQEKRAAARQSDKSAVGAGQSTEMLQYTAQSRIDPAAPELLARRIQQVDLKDRSKDQAMIGVRGYDEGSALRAAYARDLAFMAPRRGKLGERPMYESEASGGESDME
jgi:hypothetical protein